MQPQRKWETTRRFQGVLVPPDTEAGPYRFLYNYQQEFKLRFTKDPLYLEELAWEEVEIWGNQKINDALIQVHYIAPALLVENTYYDAEHIIESLEDYLLENEQRNEVRAVIYTKAHYAA